MLAIGIVVDDAIVVVENVERNMAQGMSPRDAAHKAMDEVGGAVIAITLVLSAVFVPTAFIAGISGQFYRQFALTIAASTIISAINSMTLSPALCALLLRPHREGHRALLPDAFRPGSVRLQPRLRPNLARLFARGAGLVAGKLVLVAMLAVYAGLLYGTTYMARTVPSGFLPSRDQGYVIVVIQIPNGASLSRTDEVTRRATEIMLRRPA